MRLIIFGLGYTAARVRDAVVARGGSVRATGSAGDLAFDDTGTVRLALAEATHILSSVPPSSDGDPVLDAYGADIAASGAPIGYLSSTGVYGDCGGAWVDESALVKGRRGNRNDADLAWLARGARVFRLPGIYGPGRSALDRVREGKAHRVDLPDQVFSRIHVDDIVSAVLKGFDAPKGAYNIADDAPCSQSDVIEYASAMLGLDSPPLIAINHPSLSPMARSFYGENRRVANAKAKRLLGWAPRYRDYRDGLRALNATAMPASANALPIAASSDQR